MKSSVLAEEFGALGRAAGLWTLLSLSLNLPWEIAQLPFYTLISERTAADAVFAIVHCTIGDGLIAFTSFFVTSALLRHSNWPVSKPVVGWVLITIAGMVYTAWSEWRNVYQLGSWAYSASMPLVLGIGLSPLLQWLFIPATTLLLFRVVRRSGPQRQIPATEMDGDVVFPRHTKSSAVIAASVEELFAYADDFSRLSSHMSKSSWMMAGGSMACEMDDGRGQKVGSLIRMFGRVPGIRLSLEERIVERQPPRRKVWATTMPPRLVVIGSYRLGFEIANHADGAHFRVFIDYDLPEKAPARWLGKLFAGVYARWCTRRMVEDAARHFASD